MGPGHMAPSQLAASAQQNSVRVSHFSFYRLGMIARLTLS